METVCCGVPFLHEKRTVSREFSQDSVLFHSAAVQAAENLFISTDDAVDFHIPARQPAVENHCVLTGKSVYAVHIRTLEVNFIGIHKPREITGQKQCVICIHIQIGINVTAVDEVSLRYQLVSVS